MKTQLGLVTTLSISLLLFACSPVDSLKPFNEQQAALLLHENKDTKPTQQRIHIALPKNTHWKKVDMSQHTIGTPLMLIPIEEQPTKWTESIRTQIGAYLFYPQMTMQQFVYHQIQTAHQNCRQVTNHILDQTADYIIYQITLAGCYEEQNQYQIGKAFKGVDAIYNVYYSAIAGQQTEKEIAIMSQVIKAATLVTAPNHYLSSK